MFTGRPAVIYRSVYVCLGGGVRAGGVPAILRPFLMQARNVHVLGCHKALKSEFCDPLTLTLNYLRTPDITMKSR